MPRQKGKLYSAQFKTPLVVPGYKSQASGVTVLLNYSQHSGKDIKVPTYIPNRMTRIAFCPYGCNSHLMSPMLSAFLWYLLNRRILLFRRTDWFSLISAQFYKCSIACQPLFPTIRCWLLVCIPGNSGVKVAIR